jgi:hypothetical protein
MKPSSGDKQLALASPRESAASQSNQTNNPSKDEVRNEVGLDVSHHARISQRGGENFFPLTSSFIGRVLSRSYVNHPWNDRTASLAVETS